MLITLHHDSVRCLYNAEGRYNDKGQFNTVQPLAASPVSKVAHCQHAKDHAAQRDLVENKVGTVTKSTISRVNVEQGSVDDIRGEQTEG